MPDDVEIMREDIQGWLVETDGALMVALDTTLDDGLVAEGAARELVNRIQNMRKDAGLRDHRPDHDRVRHRRVSLAERLASQQRYIMSETLAEEWISGYAGRGPYGNTGTQWRIHHHRHHACEARLINYRMER